MDPNGWGFQVLALGFTFVMVTRFACFGNYVWCFYCRICEICGEHANNITGAVDMRFMEEWNENRSIVDSERRRGCWQSQPLCNFLMACLMIAFVLPWFFRVNMF
ncbi:hypothetical protein LIER_32870 [Lithospermum erythrorhizon]|uniref:Transmembrane protein n=1 Tax=Lithospermum erythrorhizon TaxID=34254 RepID=A0AAV3RZ42_LITER